MCYFILLDEASSGIESTERSWEMEKHKIKALDDKYRWKLNEQGVSNICRCNLLY